MKPRILALQLLAALALTLAGAASASASPAGEWIQRTCSYGGEYIAPEGWEATDLEKYPQAPREFCELGGGFAVFAAPASDHEPYAGQMWTYKAPHGSAIAGGSLYAKLTARNGYAAVKATLENHTTRELQVCAYESCEHFEGSVPLPAGASELTVLAICLPAGSPYECHGPETQQDPNVFSAEGEVTDPEVILSTDATPKASGFSGTLFHGPVTGAGTLEFTATDGGPGVYQVRVKINGTVVLSETPNPNNGRCAAIATPSGIRAFDYAEPCPDVTPVSSKVPTAGVPDGNHTLEVEVEDAAGNVATVYTGTVATFNPTPAPAGAQPASAPERGSCNGSPCEETAQLTASAGEARTVHRPLKRSSLTLTGRLTTRTGAPIKDAQVKLLQRLAGSAETTQVATATTNAAGSWSLKAPSGPCRLLQVAFYSHTLDAVPAATLDFHENVPAIVSIHAPRSVRLGEFFDFAGKLAGGYIPPGGEEVQVQIKYGGRWRELQLVNANSHGEWKYRYAFTLEPGTRWAFRAIAVRNGSYPFVSHESRTIHVAVRR